MALLHVGAVCLALWSFVLCSTAAASASVTNCTYPDLISATADELEAGLKGGCFSSVDLVNAYIARIQEVNSTVHAVTELNPQAVEIAEQLDQERKNGSLRGPLHGLPVLIKGNIATQDELQTTAGSYALLNAQPPSDSTIAAKLRQAGLIILGKADLSQWANFRSFNSSNGWSAYGGQVYGAYYPGQDPRNVQNGSSSGSGVASDLGLAFAALGTETSGSIVSPSEVNNIVGIKPTVGLTSRYLVVPISERQDTVGPMARTVKDAAQLLQVIAGPDPKDNYTLASPFGSNLPDYVAACKLTGLQGKRIGIPRNVIAALQEDYMGPYIAAFNAAVSVIAAAGATIIDNTNFTAFDTFNNSTVPDSVLFADFISDLATYLSELKTNPHNLHSLEDVRAFTQHFPLEDYPARDTAVWDAALAAGINNTSPQFWPLYQQNRYFGDEGGVLGALKKYNLDAVILPTDFAYPVPAVVGAPIVTVPLGAYPNGTAVQRSPPWNLVEAAPGIPFGISFMGPLWSEESLIGMAYAFEQRTLVRDKLRRYIEPHTQLKDIV